MPTLPSPEPIQRSLLAGVWPSPGERERSQARWLQVPLLQRDTLQQQIAAALVADTPLLVGKIGANELQLLYWLEKLPMPGRAFHRRHIHFWNLRTCASNAGLKPRNRKSYREFGALLKEAATQADYLGVWQQPEEINLYITLQLRNYFFSLFDLSPWFASPGLSWSHRLQGKKVFIVSPFLQSILIQYPKRTHIWRSCPGLLPELANISGYQFPFLISRNSSLSWQDVFLDVSDQMRQSDFDVALLGCGALGLPLGLEAKRLGRQAIHMGGYLQVLFGIHGGRFRRDPSYNQFFNDHWIAPSSEETPPESSQVEEGCYW